MIENFRLDRPFMLTDKSASVVLFFLILNNETVEECRRY